MMKFKLFFLSALVFLGFSFSAQAADTFQLDPSHTYVLFHIEHFGFSSQVGKWMASGILILDKNNPQNNKVKGVVQVANIVTGIDELNNHLKSPKFFDVAKFPTATFVSDQVNVTGKNTAKVHGMLTLHGVSKPITLDVRINKEGVSPITNQLTVGFQAHTKIKRSDFGMSTLLPGLGDEVKINIAGEAYKPQ